MWLEWFGRLAGLTIRLAWVKEASCRSLSWRLEKGMTNAHDFTNGQHEQSYLISGSVASSLAVAYCSMTDLGADYDTFAFLGGLLLPRDALQSTNIHPMLMLPGTTAISVLMAYAFRDNHPAGTEDPAKRISSIYFSGEYATNEFLTRLRL